MINNTWNLDQLKHQLSLKKEIKAWIITQEHVHRRERYFMSEESNLITDQDRSVHSTSINIKLLVHSSKPEKQGEISKKLFSSLSVKEQIDTAVEAALLTEHQCWDLPVNIPSEIPQLLTSDPAMAEDLDRVMNTLTQTVNHAVGKKRETRFDSAELFLSVSHKELHLSNGLIQRSSQSRIYSEASYSFSKIGKNKETLSDEYTVTQWGVSLNHLPLEKIFDVASENAQHTLDVVKPITGKYAVLIDADVLMTLLQGHVSHLYSANAYHGLPFIKPGEDLIPGAQGDLITLSLDPSLEYGANTVAISDQGLIQYPLKLVEKNRVVASAVDQQYGNYMGWKPTTTRGNLVVESGNFSFEELTQHAPQVLEILQFSGLFADPNSGTFSSEIRLARLYNRDLGTVKYIKGGSLSGSIHENFQNLKLSKKMVSKAHFSSESPVGLGYFGPEYALLNNVSIVG